MKIVRGLFGFIALLGLSGCGGSPTQDALKSTVGMSKEQVESLFGKPETSILDSSSDHPGGYWVYKLASGASCKLRFDLPPRVVGVDC